MRIILQLTLLVLLSLTRLSAQAAHMEGGGNIHHSLTPFDTSVFLDPGGLSDLDGDGVADFAFATSLFFLGPSVVGVFSGSSGLEFLHIPNTTFEGSARHAVSAGDVNGDGVEDIMVKASEVDNGALQSVGAVHVFSGTDGSLLHTIKGTTEYSTFPSDLLGIGDLDGDGKDDFLISQSEFEFGAFGQGRVWAYSGDTGLELFHINGGGAVPRFAAYLAPMGDMDGDGVQDFGVSDGERARVRFYSGATGLLIYTAAGSGGLSNGFGSVLRSLGDLNGDGIHEFYARETFFLDRTAIMRSGLDGSVYYTFTQDAFEEYKSTQGIDAGGLGDVDGDGVPDFYLTDYFADPDDFGRRNAGSLSFHSGANGIRFATFLGVERDQNLGRFVSPLGDIDGDGREEVLLGGQRKSRLMVVGLDSFLSSATTVMPVSSGGSVNLNLDFPDAAAGLEYRVLMTPNGMRPRTYGVTIPLSSSSELVDTWAGIYPFPVHSGLGGTLDGSGDAVASFSLPSLLSSLDGSSFWMAGVAYPTGQLPAYSTAALEIRFIP